jgi:soluble lytic murein transglycosylase-like protein
MVAPSQPGQPGWISSVLGHLNPISAAHGETMPTPAPTTVATQQPTTPTPTPAATAGAPAPAPTPAPAPATPAPAPAPASASAPANAEKPATPSATPPATQGAPAEKPVEKPAPSFAKGDPQIEGERPDTSKGEQYTRGPVWHGPLLELQRQRPDLAATVEKIAEREGIDPARLAAHWYAESRLRTSSEDGSAGERGIMQVKPGTQQEVDPKMQLNPANLEDSLTMGARYIRKLDDRFGKDTVTSWVGYNQGAGGAHAFAQDPSGYMKAHSGVGPYIKTISGGQDVPNSSITSTMHVDPIGFAKAAQQGGPQGMINFVQQTNPGVPISNAMSAHERALMNLGLLHGGVEGYMAARDHVFMMHHEGANIALMNGYKALQAGNPQAAIHFLGQANTFFPDGQIGKFGIDQGGNIWAQRFDEHDPSKPLGDHFQITPDGIMGMMTTTRDPQKFVGLLMQQRAAASKARLDEAHAKYYEDMPAERLQAAEVAAQGHRDVAETNATSRANTADTVAAGKAAAADAAHGAKVDGVAREIGAGDKGIYNDVTDPQQRGTMEQVHHSLRVDGGVPTAGAASDLSRGVVDGRYEFIPLGDGRGAIVPKGGTKDPAHASVLAVVGQHATAALQRQLKPSQSQGTPMPPPNQGGSNLRATTGAPA